MQKDIIDCLNNIALFDKLIPNELETISKYMYTIKITKGKILFNEGDKGDHVCFIIDGKLDVIKKSGDNDTVVISTLSKGRSIGDMSIIDNFPRSATIKGECSKFCVTVSDSKFTTTASGSKSQFREWASK